MNNIKACLTLARLIKKQPNLTGLRLRAVKFISFGTHRGNPQRELTERTHRENPQRELTEGTHRGNSPRELTERTHRGNSLHPAAAAAAVAAAVSSAWRGPKLINLPAMRRSPVKFGCFCKGKACFDVIQFYFIFSSKCSAGFAASLPFDTARFDNIQIHKSVPREPLI